MARLKRSKIRKELNKSDKVNNINNNRITGRKLNKYNLTIKEMNQDDKDIIQEENFSVFFILLILLLCFIAGISLGYCLYRIAIK